MTTKNAPAAKREKTPLVEIVRAGENTFRQIIELEHGAAVANRQLARWMVGVQQRVFRTPELANCNGTQLLAALAEACQWGFEAAPSANHFSLVPFKGDCQMIPSAQGLVYIAEQSGRVEEVRFGVLHRCDAVRMEQQERPLFDPDTNEPQVRDSLIDDDEDRSDDAVCGAWCAVKLKDDPKWRKLYMRRSDIEKRREASQAPNSPAWKNWYAEMAIKTVVKKLMKSGRIPMGRQIDFDGEVVKEADFDVSETQAPPSSAQSTSDSLDVDVFPPDRDESLEAIEDWLDQDNSDTHQEDAARLHKYAIDTYGKAIDDMNDAQLAQVVRDLEAGKVG